VSEQESQLSDFESRRGDVEIGSCHICAMLFRTQEDLLTHLAEAHGVKAGISWWDDRRRSRAAPFSRVHAATSTGMGALASCAAVLPRIALLAPRPRRPTTRS
jgi:uncharacterized C2H2 Zn-finger protein